NHVNIVHPELEALSPGKALPSGLEPVYSSTEKLVLKGLDSKGRRKLLWQLITQLRPEDLPENLSAELMRTLRLASRYEMIRHIHFPRHQEPLWAARTRFKFEELFFLQMLLLRAKVHRDAAVRGFVFREVGTQVNPFY